MPPQPRSGSEARAGRAAARREEAHGDNVIPTRNARRTTLTRPTRLRLRHQQVGHQGRLVQGSGDFVVLPVLSATGLCWLHIRLQHGQVRRQGWLLLVRQWERLQDDHLDRRHHRSVVAWKLERLGQLGRMGLEGHPGRCWVQDVQRVRVHGQQRRPGRAPPAPALPARSMARNVHASCLPESKVASQGPDLQDGRRHRVGS